MSHGTRRSTAGPGGTLALLLVSSLLASTTAEAQVRYSLSGNSRAQIGNGLPLPITFAPAPQGAVQLQPGAYVFQTTGPDPKAMTLVRPPDPIFSTTMRTIAVFLAASKVFQVRTSLLIDGPVNGTLVPNITTPTAIVTTPTAMFSAGGRTGPAVVSWCPGFPVPGTATNPGCVNATLGTPMKGRLKYTATANQFGGTSRVRIGAAGTQGGASVVNIVGGAAAPCTHTRLGGLQPSCLAAFSQVVLSETLHTAPTTGAATFMTPGLAVAGGPFGVFDSDAGNAGPIHPVKVTAGGKVVSVAPTVIAQLPANSVQTWGGPVTTGTVTVEAPQAAGGGETFKLQGGDDRIDGVGSISLVSGGLSKRFLSGDNANRSWLNYQVGLLEGVSVPSISNGGLVLLGLLMVAATAWMLRRAVATS
jgi:hypothetical protein